MQCSAGLGQRILRSNVRAVRYTVIEPAIRFLKASDQLVRPALNQFVEVAGRGTVKRLETSIESDSVNDSLRKE